MVALQKIGGQNHRRIRFGPNAKMVLDLRKSSNGAALNENMHDYKGVKIWVQFWLKIFGVWTSSFGIWSSDMSFFYLKIFIVLNGAVVKPLKGNLLVSYDIYNFTYDIIHMKYNLYCVHCLPKFRNWSRSKY